MNLGLRWEYDAPPTEENNLLGNWEPAVGFEQVGKQIGSVYNPDHKDFGPRVGHCLGCDRARHDHHSSRRRTFLLSASDERLYQRRARKRQHQRNYGDTDRRLHDRRTRGGTCPQTFGGTIATTTLTLKPSALNWTLAGPVLPAAAGAQSCTAASQCSILAMDRNFAAPYVATWTLSLQHAFSNTVSLETAYVGDHGDRLAGIVDLNQPNLATGIRPYATQYPYLQFINYLTNLDRSNYNGLQATLTARNYHNLSVVAGYTYAHALDDASHNFGTVVPQDSTNPNAMYGPSDFDIRHRFTLSVTYDIPGKKSPAQLLEGWQLNSIVTLQTSQPWDAVDTADNISEALGKARIAGISSAIPDDFQSNNTSIPYCTGRAPGAAPKPHLKVRWLCRRRNRPLLECLQGGRSQGCRRALPEKQ